jgi:hypothetical protein
VGQQLGGVAGAEHLVDGGEARGALVAAEVGREHALRHAPPAQELARAARRPRARRGGSGGRGRGGPSVGSSSSSSGHVDRRRHWRKLTASKRRAN